MMLSTVRCFDRVHGHTQNQVIYTGVHTVNEPSIAKNNEAVAIATLFSIFILLQCPCYSYLLSQAYFSFNVWRIEYGEVQLQVVFNDLVLVFVVQRRLPNPKIDLIFSLQLNLCSTHFFYESDSNLARVV
jgi:hypothetical protein